MSVDVKVPELGESITEVEVSAVLKSEGDSVEMDEPVFELESDKATVEVPAPAAGALVEILVEEGAVLKVGDVMARIDESASGSGSSGSAETEDSGDPEGKASDDAEEDSPAAEEDSSAAEEEASGTEDDDSAGENGPVMPAAKRAMQERGISEDEVRGSGPGGRVLKEDVPEKSAARSEKKQEKKQDEKQDKKPETKGGKSAPKDEAPRAPDAPSGDREVRRKRMSPIRRRIAERLVSSQQNAALLTTFNEIDMSRIKVLRAENQEAFVERYGVKLGFMSIFVKAAVEALQLIPGINAQIEGEEIVYHDYCDIGIAVGGGKGLVVPVIRNAEMLGFGDVELTIGDFAQRAQDNKLDLSELEGGTFTISNGGVYGSLMSTPIINPPQSGVLGLHAIQDRAVVIDGQVEVRPMMYVALTYDHRLVDGREAVTFLKHIKDVVERPERLLLKV